MQNIIFFDIDGTLMMGNGKVPPSAVKAIEMAKAKGNKIIINSGRALSAIPEVIKALKPDGYVCGCGTAVYLNEKKIFHSTLPEELCRHIAEELRRHRICAQLESEEHTYSDLLNPANTIARCIMLRRIFGRQLRFFAFRLPRPFVFDKFFAVGEPQVDMQLLAEIVGPTMELIPRENGCAEVVQKGITKATGMDIVRQELGVPLENCYAIGDGNNDIPMLEHVPHAVAMGNYNGDILQYCEFVTTDIDKDGIYNALAHYELI